jgi:hypothetical protein
VREAAQLAALAAPYRHARLSAVKHIDHADSIDGISANATPEELRAEIAKRIAMLRDRGYVNLDALPPPEPAKCLHDLSASAGIAEQWLDRGGSCGAD